MVPKAGLRWHVRSDAHLFRHVMTSSLIAGLGVLSGGFVVLIPSLCI